MNVVLIVGAVFILLCVLYGWAFSEKKDIVLMAITGNPCETIVPQNYESPPKSVKLVDGRYINTKNYTRVIIHGNHLSGRGVNEGEEWLVDPKCRFILGDIVLLKWKEDVYILRAVKNLGTTKIIVSWRDRDQEIEETYELKSITGVLRYCI